MAYALRLPMCGGLWKNAIYMPKSMQILQPMATATSKLKPNENFWEKNSRLNRPLSPHLTIYSFQITSVLSVTHRGTGIGLGTVLYGFAVGTLLLPSNYPHYIEWLSSLHISPLISVVKFGLAWSFFFHYFNGIRHLAWDAGYGFELSNLYKSGYAVLGLSTILSLLVLFA
ncbi:succinate dehydrogenase cytochrome b560 subunit, mitochondrial-like [Centruroides sculpturatus]|uniref:succinate dehydrogenase cytochrome b560 subunit, mitochondrial-like n=1 Tax=Centruroides sculpturatus TaxID=218467 RepID=UPI000C6E0054|nr:succinate dehydrogenase cytochrome b560 subunit, mitochondrial-like [Centruroides sculpturatus]